MRNAMAMAGSLLVTFFLGVSLAGTTTSVDLLPSAAVPAASGSAAIHLRKSSEASFDVSVRHLASKTTYAVLVGGVNVGALTTSRGGSGRIKFSSKGTGRDRFLGFDPLGAAIEVRDDGGDDVLTGNLPDTRAEGAAPCCAQSKGRHPHVECEMEPADECAARGGTLASTPSCLPDPCGATPPADSATVCCVPDDGGPSCEDRTQADCVAAGGTLVEAASCAPNPCVAPAQPPDTEIQCCIPAYYTWGCTAKTVAACAAVGGIAKGPGSCAQNPCAGIPPDAGHGVCCLPNGEEIECEDRAADACVAAGGVAKGAGVCGPTTCADVTPPPPAPEIRCCQPNPAGTEIECDLETASACSAVGGVAKGEGVCGADTCADVPPPSPKIACCVQAYYTFTCEDLTPEACDAEGGVDQGAEACAVDTCASVPPKPAHGICCAPNVAGDEIECEDLGATACGAAGGTVKPASAGVCGPTTCADVLPPNPDVRCCLPSTGGGETECEPRTEAACSAAGGVNEGAGVCALDTCVGVLPPTASVQCCLPKSNGRLGCKDRTAERCTVEGGTSVGVGVCPASDPCR